MVLVRRSRFTLELFLSYQVDGYKRSRNAASTGRSPPAGGTDSAFEYPLQRRNTTSDELTAKAMYRKQPDQTHRVLMRLCEQRNVACCLAVEHRFVALFEVEGDAGAGICKDWLTVIFDALLLW
ncbi:hypothetical protein LTR35_015496 [Friedmanniomyces endolithicus]|uniref:Uncharacterized protein n=1 Tax=Friedmanniomyces endolithicus TaxID=329885 RepID=A0AAN6F7I0_9PEZI|nr:hypothetical protein LTR35_015496 [Friedmanniomyces endolithicus]KAK0276386.1 hypothetical protein LTS00_014646 [Friedmanniomyces endolithicus]KAK0308208.1 hypothetical protein LTR82_015662 [Friedmanniomyces endolithicus]KAK1017110.1 hypothetical protein LTR54_002486 [Friedmanniomyces endolithicus]